MLSAKIEKIKLANLFINKKCLKTQTKDVEMNDFFFKCVINRNKIEKK